MYPVSSPLEALTPVSVQTVAERLSLLETARALMEQWAAFLGVVPSGNRSTGSTRACGPLCRLKPALQARDATSALELHAEAGAAFPGDVVTCAAPSAARAGLETGVPSRHAIKLCSPTHSAGLPPVVPA